jgi:hypothetical protein
MPVFCVGANDTYEHRVYIQEATNGGTHLQDKYIIFPNNIFDAKVHFSNKTKNTTLGQICIPSTRCIPSA